MNALYTSLNQAIHNVSEMTNECLKNERAEELKRMQSPCSIKQKVEFKSKNVCNFEICFVWMAVFSLLFFFLRFSDRKQLCSSLFVVSVDGVAFNNTHVGSSTTETQMIRLLFSQNVYLCRLQHFSKSHCTPNRRSVCRTNDLNTVLSTNK